MQHFLVEASKKAANWTTVGFSIGSTEPTVSTQILK
jgi:hypothetical protein